MTTKGDVVKYILFIISIVAFSAPSQAKIYKWVDENGRMHFSDKPYSEDAKVVKIKGTGIKVEGIDAPVDKENSTSNQARRDGKPSKAAPEKKNTPPSKAISESDYRITASVGKLGADIIRISGRVSSGPKCEDMTVTAIAKSDKGHTATVTDNIEKPNSFGSSIFEGNAKATGSGDDYSTWKVDSVKVTCNDN